MTTLPPSGEVFLVKGFSGLLKQKTYTILPSRGHFFQTAGDNCSKISATTNPFNFNFVLISNIYTNRRESSASVHMFRAIKDIKI